MLCRVWIQVRFWGPTFLWAAILNLAFFHPVFAANDPAGTQEPSDADRPPNSAESSDSGDLLQWFDTSTAKTWTLAPSPNEFLLHFEGDPSDSSPDFAQWLNELGATPTEPFRTATRTQRVRVDGVSGAVSEDDLSAKILTLGSFRPLVRAVRIDQEGFEKFLRPGEFLVQFRSLDESEMLSLIQSSGATIRREYWTPGLYRISVPASSNLEATLREWGSWPEVRFAEPAYLCFDDLLANGGTQSEPNDPLLPNQWGLRNPGNGSWKSSADVHADAAWWIETGDPNVVIVYIDTGADILHEDLVDGLLPRNGDDWNFADAGSDEPYDVLSHGTAVAGIGSATQDNGMGVSGLAPGCRFMPLRASLDAGDFAERVDAINYAASRRPEFAGLILNCSWGNSTGDYTSQRLAILDAHAAGCLLVCASGNSNDNVIYPAKYPETIAVGATSPCDERTQSTSCDGENWGSCFGPELDVVAPGVHIQTTDRSGSFGYSGTSYYSEFNGTSSAAPLVSAAAALLLSVNPDLSPEETRQLLWAGADDEVGRADEDTPGFDIYHGFGRVNIYRSLVLATFPEGFDDDLESSVDSWQHREIEDGVDAWGLSSDDNQTPGGAWSWSTANPSTGAYLPGIHAGIYPPDVWVPAGGYLRFFHRMDAAEFGAGVAADGGWVEGSVDGGETWNVLVPSTGYTHLTGLVSDPFPSSSPVFSGQFGWTETEIDLEAFGDAPIRIRFVFGSQANPTSEIEGSGWWIDDVRVEDTPSAVSNSDPDSDSDAAQGSFWISAPAVIESATDVQFGWEGRIPDQARLNWRLHSVSGRVVLTGLLESRDTSRSSFRIYTDHSPSGALPSGVYFLRVEAGNQVAEKKFTLLR